MAIGLEALKTRVRTAPDWILPGLLKRGNTGFILGQPKKACKSWLMLELAFNLSEGKPIWSITSPHTKADGTIEQRPLFTPAREMRTVYFTQEDTEDDVHDRVMNHLNSGARVNDRVWIVPKNLTLALDSDSGRAGIQRELDEVRENVGPIDLVMFDPMRRMHHGDENDSNAIAKLWTVLDRIHRKYACATLISHHTVKPPRAEGSLFDPSDPFVARGSGDIYGGGDAFMTIVPKRLDRGGIVSVDPSGANVVSSSSRKLIMHFESKRGKPIAPVALRVKFDTGAVEYCGVAWDRKEEGDETVNI